MQITGSRDRSALFCSKIATNDAHHLLNVYLQFLCDIKTLTLRSVYEISLE